MSSTWEEPEEDAPTEAPSPSDAPTGDEKNKTGTEQAEKNREEDPPA